MVATMDADVGVNTLTVDYFSVFYGITWYERSADLFVSVSYCNCYCVVFFEFSIVKDFSAFLN